MDFTFCRCPLCNTWLLPPLCSPIYQVLLRHEVSLARIQDMSMQRLRHEDRLNDQPIMSAHSKFFQKPEEYALSIYCYYQCFLCERPYFGGLSACEQMVAPQTYQAQELLCPSCVPNPEGKQECSIHGSDFIEYKCAICCTVAQFFCFGTTHMCDKCHSSYKPSRKPKACLDQKTCPLKMSHGSGKMTSLGCALCRNYKA